MIQQDVQEMLQRRSRDVRPAVDGWQRIIERIEVDGDVVSITGEQTAHRRPRRLVAVAAAAAVALGAGVAVRNGTDDVGLLEAAAPPETTASTAPVAPAPATATTNPPVWPATSDDGIAALRGQVASGERSELVDPRATAGAYLSERFLAQDGRPSQSFSLGDYVETTPGVGQVKYESPVGTGRGGVVDVERLGGDGPDPIWVVTGSTSSALAVHMVGYDGMQLTGEAISEVAGTMEVTLSSTDGSDPVSIDQLPAAPGRPVDLRQVFAGKPGLVVRLRIGAALAEVRVDVP